MEKIIKGVNLKKLFNQKVIQKPFGPPAVLNGGGQVAESGILYDYLLNKQIKKEMSEGQSTSLS